jgi:hypothetical protein
MSFCSAPAGIVFGRPTVSAARPGKMVKTDDQIEKDKAELGSGEPDVTPEVWDISRRKKSP